MHLITLAAILTPLAAPVAAFWRLPCVAPLVQQRADPIISPGTISSHLHTIMGGNGFDFDMDYGSTQASTCSSCLVKGDFSNYWIPVLFYRHQDDTFEKVNQFGGGTIYYIHRSAEGERITAFPKGFRMVAGDPFKRSAGTDGASLAISYNCLDYGGPPEGFKTYEFPSFNCPDGLRSQVFFPSCWDGVNVDSPNHKSHVSYPDGEHDGGKCPKSHPVRLMALFYEVVWDTNAFANMWYEDSQPFVWSMGDPTGYGLHGDFLNGWDVQLLQEAADTCTDGTGLIEKCPVFELYSADQSWACNVPDRVQERTTGNLDSLPGCNPVQYGPARATKCGSSSAPPPTPQSAPGPDWEVNSNPDWDTDTEAEAESDEDTPHTPSSQEWTYLGCAPDMIQSRSLASASYTSDTMTNSACKTYCVNHGFSYAGTEYSRECYCGNAFPRDRLPSSGARAKCDMLCSGAEGEVCGGSDALSLWQVCRGGKCGGLDLEVEAEVERSVVARGIDVNVDVPGDKNGRSREEEKVMKLSEEDANNIRMSVSRTEMSAASIDGNDLDAIADASEQRERERHIAAHVHHARGMRMRGGAWRTHGRVH